MNDVDATLDDLLVAQLGVAVIAWADNDDDRINRLNDACRAWLNRKETP